MSSSLPAASRFQKLVNDIAKFYTDARRAQVQFAWETGRRIVEEEQNGQMHAAYGSSLIIKLSETLSKKFGPGFSERTLQKMRHFYTHHSIPPTSAKLGWSDYVELMPVRDGKTRKQLEVRILKEGLKRHEIRQVVKGIRKSEMKNATNATNAMNSMNAMSSTNPTLKFPTGLVLNTFSLSSLKVKVKTGHVQIDCGFFVSWPVKKAKLTTLDIQEEKSYTYVATIDRVVDGDTLLVMIEVGFGIIVHQRLRLRGINCPEMSTPEGVRAKKFVEKLLPESSTIVIKSHKNKRDIYGRFVVDVFFSKGVDDASAILKDSTYLNQLLLDEGHAEIYK